MIFPESLGYLPTDSCPPLAEGCLRGINSPILLHPACVWDMGTAEHHLLGEVPRADNWRDMRVSSQGGFGWNGFTEA